MFLKGKVALITGSASGIGLAYAKFFLKNGLKGVTLADLDVVKGKKALEEITKQYGENKAIFAKLDVVDKKQFEDAMKKTVEVFGNFDILINNAGIMSDAIWEKEIDINLKGTINGSILALEEYLPKYKSTGEPVIVNIASILGLNLNYFLPIYGSTKTAVIALTRSFALEENSGSQKVRVLAVCPGVTATSLLDELGKRVFTPRHKNAESYLEEHQAEYPIQTAEMMAEAMVKILENGENGSIWVVEGGQISQVDVPLQADLKILKRL